MSTNLSLRAEVSTNQRGPDNPGYLHQFVEQQRRRGRLVLQPRVGMGGHRSMRQALEAIRAFPAPVVGTITLDSYSRQADAFRARRAVLEGHTVNGYPILGYRTEENRALIRGLQGPGFPIQVRHGSALPDEVFEALLGAGIEATEGGPVSYCLPYSRVPLRDSVEAWGRCCRRLAELEARGTIAHLETFGGCLLGQLCPPALLIATAILEGLFFRSHGIGSVSLGLTQGSNPAQDVGALIALRRLAEDFLGDVSWHLVLYTFMGSFPRTRRGARRLVEDSVSIAARGRAERLIVKTAAEAHRIPTLDDNLEALGWADAAFRRTGYLPPGPDARDHAGVQAAQARALIEAVLNLAPSLDRGLVAAFELGILDVPFCPHPDNSNRARTWIDADGTISWARLGRLPLPVDLAAGRRDPSSSELRKMLSYNRVKYDEAADEEELGKPFDAWPGTLEHAAETAVLATIPSDSHVWNLTFLEKLLEEQGCRVVNLGMCTPVEEVRRACEAHRPRWVVVSTVNGHGHLEAPALAATLAELSGRPHLRLVIGGQLCIDDRRAVEVAAALERSGFDNAYVGEDAIPRFLARLDEDQHADRRQYRDAA